MSAARLIASKYERNFRIEYNRETNFFDVFCPFLRPLYEIPEDGTSIPVVNLIDSGITDKNLSVMDQWLKQNPTRPIRLSINNLGPVLASYFRLELLEERLILKAFCNDFIFPERGSLQKHLAKYEALFWTKNVLGLHVRTGIFGDKAFDGRPLVPSLDDILKQSHDEVKRADMVFLACDNPVLKATILEELGKVTPVLTFPIMPTHLERRIDGTSKNPSPQSSLMDWLLLRMCRYGILGTAGRYSQSAAFSNGIEFRRINPTGRMG